MGYYNESTGITYNDDGTISYGNTTGSTEGFGTIQRPSSIYGYNSEGKGSGKVWETDGKYRFGSDDTYKFDPSGTVSDQVLANANNTSVDSLLRDKERSDKAVSDSVLGKDQGFTFNNVMKGLDTFGAIADVGLGLGELNLAQDQYKFNKKMKENEWKMAKEAYERSKKRAGSISNQMTSYGSNVK